MIEKKHYQAVYAVIILISLVLSVISLLFIKSYVGYVGYSLNGSAGYIHQINIIGPIDFNEWAGVYGLAILSPSNPKTLWNLTLSGGDLEREDLFFNCHAKTGFDIYASTLNQTELDLTSITPATAADIDNWIGINSSVRYSANQTFNDTLTVNFGGVNHTVPAVDLYPKNVSWKMGVLKDGNGVLVFTTIAEQFKRGFNDNFFNYQMMLPIRTPYENNSVTVYPNETYYFFADPVSDLLGNCSITERAFLHGYVVDIRDNSSLDNVSINVSGFSTFTNASGFYNLLIDVGTHILLGQKDGFREHISPVEVEFGVVNWHNFSMIPDFGSTIYDAELFGYVFKNTTACQVNFSVSSCSVPNAFVSGGGGSDITNSTGQYRFPLQSGDNVTVVAFAAGFNASILQVNISLYESKELNITLVPPAEEAKPQNGTVTGIVFEEGTTTTIDNATIAIGSTITFSNLNGSYTVNVSESLYYTVIAIKDGYFPFIGNLSGNNSVLANQTVYYNIELEPLPPELPDLQPQPESSTRRRSDDSSSPIITEVQQPSPLDVFVSLNEIIKKVKRGNFVDETVSIFNFKNEPIRLRFEAEGNVAPSIELSTDEIVIAANSTDQINVRLLGNQPEGKYFGNIKIRGDYNYNIPVFLIITEDVEIPVRTLLMNLEPLGKGYIGREFKYELDLVNLLIGRRYDVNLSFFISDINKTNTTFIGDHSLNIQTFSSLIRSYNIPKETLPGDYILSAQAEYLGITSTTDTLFTIVYPFYQYKLFGFLPVWILALILAILLLGLIAFLIIKRELDKRKRFKVQIDYKELPKEGPRSLFVGMIAETKKRAYFDMDILTVHSIVAGSTGGGKSIAAQDIVEETLIKGAAIVVFDPTAQWSGMLRKCVDKKMLSFYGNMGMKTKEARAFPGNIRAVNDGREMIDIYKYWKAGEIQVFTTSRLEPKDYDLFVANTIRQIFRSNLQEYRGLRYMLVYDEIHRILPKFGGSGQGFIQIERGCREFRKWGIGILLISQVLQDFVGQIKANINTNVQMKTRDEGDLGRIKQNYGEEFIQALIKAPVGSGMVQNSAWNRGRPYYITFRPILHSVVRLSDEELDKYNKYNDIVDDLEYQFEQLEGEGQDVFDLKLELKLSKDKIKSGNFNMVQIYLDGLTPRIEKLWNKLGKKPKKLEKQLVDVEEMEKEIEQAKQEHDEAAEKAKEQEQKDKEKAKKEEAEKEEEIDEELAKANLESIGQLATQVRDLIPHKDWNTINDLIMEITSVPLPKKDVPKKEKTIQELKTEIETAKNPPKEEEEEEKDADKEENK